MKIFGGIVLSAVLVVSAAAVQRGAGTGSAAQPITVYRTATCGCCAKWVDHLKANGFEPTVHIVPNTAESAAGKSVPSNLRSCHSATLEGYTVEGHVPADVIRQLLKDRPPVAGIAVPGMPAGSPGMESPRPEAYDVIAYDAAGRTTVFASRGPRRQ
jgi:hypothetical protein